MSNLADKYPRISDMRKRALRRIPHFAAEYLFSGTGYDRAMDYNQEILKNVFLTPRYLKGTVEADLKTKLFDRVYDAPFGIAPIGMTSLIWPGAELSLAKLASKVNIPYTLSTVACASIENVAKHLDNKGWFQLYPPKDKSIRDDLLKRAYDSGFYSGQDIVKGLMLGADFVMVGRPFVIALAALGARGAAHAHYIIKHEIENIMEQVCAKNIKELKRETVNVGKDFFLGSLE